MMRAKKPQWRWSPSSLTPETILTWWWVYLGISSLFLLGTVLGGCLGTTFCQSEFFSVDGTFKIFTSQYNSVPMYITLCFIFGIGAVLQTIGFLFIINAYFHFMYPSTRSLAVTFGFHATNYWVKPEIKLWLTVTFAYAFTGYFLLLAYTGVPNNIMFFISYVIGTMLTVSIGSYLLIVSGWRPVWVSTPNDQSNPSNLR